jgi:hypothetical protein
MDKSLSRSSVGHDARHIQSIVGLVLEHWRYGYILNDTVYLETICKVQIRSSRQKHDS